MNTLGAYLFKYKTKEGHWVTIPILAGDIYTAYTQYCEENGINPVAESVYYQTLGQLETLVEQLSGSAANLETITNTLEAGALPQFYGGLGVVISDTDIYVLTNTEPYDWNKDEAYTNYYKLIDGSYVQLEAWSEWESDTYYIKNKKRYNTLREALTDTSSDGLGVGVALIENLSNLKDEIDSVLALKVNNSAFAHGTLDPNLRPDLADATYYFQYKE